MLFILFCKNKSCKLSSRAKEPALNLLQELALNLFQELALNLFQGSNPVASALYALWCKIFAT
jgi:hypothetical protein